MSFEDRLERVFLTTTGKAAEALRQILIHEGTRMNNRVNRRNFLRGTAALAVSGFAGGATNAAQSGQAKPANAASSSTIMPTSSQTKEELSDTTIRPPIRAACKLA